MGWRAGEVAAGGRFSAHRQLASKILFGFHSIAFGAGLVHLGLLHSSAVLGFAWQESEISLGSAVLHLMWP